MADQQQADRQAAGDAAARAAEHPRIVVGVDGSPSSVDALRWAARMGAALGREIDVVTVWEYAAAHADTSVLQADTPEDDATGRLETAASQVFGAERPSGLRLVVRSGHSPAKVLLEASHGAEMLVLGSRGHGGFVGLLLGSVSAACTAHASCPVVVVHAE